jgi:hypothetical protein
MIPTAKKVLQSHVAEKWNKDCIDAMIEFAKLHVKAALEAASENAMGVHCTDYIDPDSITEAYPESNIK